MAFSPFARFRNFTLDNLKALLEVYPDMQSSLTWGEAGEIVESRSRGYKKTAYQQACQFGLEDRGTDRFRIQSYLFTFDDENLKRFLCFWMKTYYAPNPYVNSEDVPFIIYTELAKSIVESSNLQVDYHQFFMERIGGKSEDILMNAIKAFCTPIKYRKEKEIDKHIFYIDPQNVEILKREIDFIEEEFPIKNALSRSEFFCRYSYSNFCKFYGIVPMLPNDEMNENHNTVAKRLTGGSNVLLYGVPGSGKSFTIQKEYCADARYIERVVFHPDYTYSDFVGQILPRVEDGNLKYVFTPGPFTKLLKKAFDDPGNMYYLIIEELNRGNAPAIFGEIFQLLDRKDDDKYPKDVVGESEYSIVNYDVATVVFEDADIPVRLPSNLTILATMNTSDQNVFTLDTAFQRRWDMKHITNRVDLAKHAKAVIEGTKVDWGTFADVINEHVLIANEGRASSEDKRLGAYFATEKELQPERFSEKVLKYLWDDAFRMDREYIFADEMNSLDTVISTFEKSDGDKLAHVLRANIYAEMLKRMKTIGSEKKENVTED